MTRSDNPTPAQTQTDLQRNNEWSQNSTYYNKPTNNSSVLQRMLKDKHYKPTLNDDNETGWS